MRVDQDFFFDEYSQDCNLEQFIRAYDPDLSLSSESETDDDLEDAQEQSSWINRGADGDLSFLDVLNEEPPKKKPRLERSKNFIDLSVIVPNTQE